VFFSKSLPAAEQRLPLIKSVFLLEALPYFRQLLRSLSSLFSRRCHRCRSREFGGSSCKQRLVEVIYTTVILLLEQLCTSLAVQEINNVIMLKPCISCTVVVVVVL